MFFASDRPEGLLRISSPSATVVSDPKTQALGFRLATQSAFYWALLSTSSQGSPRSFISSTCATSIRKETPRDSSSSFLRREPDAKISINVDKKKFIQKVNPDLVFFLKHEGHHRYAFKVHHQKALLPFSTINYLSNAHRKPTMNIHFDIQDN